MPRVPQCKATSVGDNVISKAWLMSHSFGSARMCLVLDLVATADSGYRGIPYLPWAAQSLAVGSKTRYVPPAP